MGCGCRKNRGTSNDTRQADVSTGRYQVWRNGSYTGRAFTSLGSAQVYANRIGGEVRSV